MLTSHDSKRLLQQRRQHGVFYSRPNRHLNLPQTVHWTSSEGASQACDAEITWRQKGGVRPILQCSSTRCSSRDPLSHEGHQHQRQAPRIRSVRPEIPRNIRHHIWPQHTARSWHSSNARASLNQLLQGRSSNPGQTQNIMHTEFGSQVLIDEQSSRTAICNHCVHSHCRCELHTAAALHNAVEISGPMVSQPHVGEHIPPIKLTVRSPGSLLTGMRG